MISIIVPVYNGEKYLHKCLSSIRNQTYKKIEIILIDDGSTDNSSEICEKYALKDKRIKVIHTENKGPAAARNRGIEEAKGEFLFFLDADDFLEEDALDLLIKSYKRYKADLIIGDFKKIKNSMVEKRNDIPFSTSKLLNKQEILNYSRFYLKKPNKYLLFAFSWGRLFKTSIIKDNNLLFNTGLHTFEDVAFNFDYLNYTNKIFFLKEPIYNHLMHDNYLSATMTISGNPKKMFGYQQALTKNASNFLKGKISDYEIKKEIGHSYIFLTIIQLVRICGQINKNNKKKIYILIQELVNSQDLIKSLQFYSPSKGESKILPFFMRLKLVWPIIWVCKYKSNKRYKKNVGEKGRQS